MNMELKETVQGEDAIRMAETITREGGTFSISFYHYSRSKGVASDQLTTYHGCRCRKPLPRDRWSVDSKNYFLFDTADGKPKMCYKVLIRYIGFQNQDNRLKKIIWYE